MNEDSCETQVREEQSEKSERLTEDDPCSPDSGKGKTNDSPSPQHLKAALTIDSEDSCAPTSTSLDFPKTLSDSPGSESHHKWTHLTEFELKGLQALVEKLEALPENKKCVPEGIEDPQGLLEDMKVRYSN